LNARGTPVRDRSPWTFTGAGQRDPARSTSQAAPTPDAAAEQPGGAEDAVLVALDRPQQGDPAGAPRERLYVRSKVSSSGAPFFDVRLAFRNEAGGYTFTRKGVSVRMHEAPAIVVALYQALDPAGRARVRELLGAKPAPKGGERGS
jgi:hypothetical protein